MQAWDLTIDQFESAQITAESFTHEAHVFMGWKYVTTYGPEAAIPRFDAALQRLVKELGEASKYNAMITWLFLKLIAERTRSGEDWAAFRARNADLIEGRPRSPS